MILSFGLLGPGKGYESAIAAMPAVVEAIPSAVYVILGATHPDLLLREGEAYRRRLEASRAEAGVADPVRFIDRFVGRVELGTWLEAADVFVTPVPQPRPDRVRDAVVRDGRGQGDRVHPLRLRQGAARQRTRPPRGGRVLGGARGGVHRPARRSRPRGCRSAGAPTTTAGAWSGRTSAPSTRRIFARAVAAAPPHAPPRRGRTARGRRWVPPAPSRQPAPPRRDDGALGIWQHATGPMPDLAFGYCTDDVARALTVDLAHAASLGWAAVSASARRSLQFMRDAFDPVDRAVPELPRRGRPVARGRCVRGQPRARHARPGRALAQPGTTTTSPPRPGTCSPRASRGGATDGPPRHGIHAPRLRRGARVGGDRRRAPRDGDDTLRPGRPAPRRLRAGRAPLGLAVARTRCSPTRTPCCPGRSSSPDAGSADRGARRRMGLARPRLADRRSRRRDGGGSRRSAATASGHGAARAPVRPAADRGDGHDPGRRGRASPRPDDRLPRARSSWPTAGSWATTTSASPIADPATGACFDGLEPVGVNRNQGAESTLMWLTALEHDARSFARGRCAARAGHDRRARPCP